MRLGEPTHPVAHKKPNAWGLYDMHGSAWKWCWDWYGEDYYTASPRKDPMGPTEGTLRVRRGGCFNGPGSCRSAARGAMRPDLWTNVPQGFRVARSPSGQ